MKDGRLMTSPFREPTNGDAFFPDSHAGAAELKAAYACDEGLEIAMLIGDPGLGKTTVLRRLATRLAAGVHVVVDLFYPRLDADGLLSFIDEELGENESIELPVADLDRDARVRRIARQTERLAANGRGLAILIDDAHLLRDSAVFEALQLLLNLREKTGIRMTFVLAGQKALVADLTRFPALAQRIAVTSVLAPFTAAETASYIRYRLERAGWSADCFDEKLLAAIHERSAGIPRMIHRICEMALLIAQAEGRAQVTHNDLVAVDAEMPAFRDAA